MQPHPSADNWIKALLSKALPTEQDPVFPTSSLSHQEAYTSHRLLHQRVDRRSKKNHSPTEKKTKTILISMKKQKVMSQMKGQDKTPEKQLNEVEIGNLPEREFRIIIVKVIQDLGGSMEKM